MNFKLKTLASCATACAALVAAPAFAQDGLYIGGSIGQSKYKGDDIGGLSTDRKDTGGKLFGGYEFTPNIALELGYADLGKATSAAGSVKGKGAYLDAVGKVPFTPQLSGIARVGVFQGKADFEGPLGIRDSDEKTAPKVGLGLQYDVTKNVAVRGEWERYRFEAFDRKANADLYSLGMNYRF